MSNAMMTIVGNVVDEPRMRTTGNGHKVTTFRVASTSRRYDREQQTFVDGTSLYMTVTTWRGAAENAHASLHKGQPVVVYGRCSTRNFVVNEQPRTTYELDAVAVGHDLFRGTSAFERQRRGSEVTVPADEGGMPTDESDHWLGTHDDTHGHAHGDTIVDPVTGEVLTAPDPADDDELPAYAPRREGALVGS